MLYTKNGKISSLRTLYNESKDQWISNPTPEQIAEAGWVEYVPEVTEEDNDGLAE